MSVDWELIPVVVAVGGLLWWLPELLVVLYAFASLVLGVTAIYNHGELYAGLAGIFGSNLCLIAVAGARAAMMGSYSNVRPEGRRRAREEGAYVAGVIMGFAGLGSIWHSGFRVLFLDYEIAGLSWAVVGLLLGWTLGPTMARTSMAR